MIFLEPKMKFYSYIYPTNVRVGL